MTVNVYDAVAASADSLGVLIGRGGTLMSVASPLAACAPDVPAHVRKLRELLDPREADGGLIEYDAKEARAFMRAGFTLGGLGPLPSACDVTLTDESIPVISVLGTVGAVEQCTLKLKTVEQYKLKYVPVTGTIPRGARVRFEVPVALGVSDKPSDPLPYGVKATFKVVDDRLVADVAPTEWVPGRRLAAPLIRVDGLLERLAGGVDELPAPPYESSAMLAKGGRIGGHHPAPFECQVISPPNGSDSHWWTVVATDHIDPTEDDLRRVAWMFPVGSVVTVCYQPASFDKQMLNVVSRGPSHIGPKWKVVAPVDPPNEERTECLDSEDARRASVDRQSLDDAAWSYSKEDVKRAASNPLMVLRPQLERHVVFVADGIGTSTFVVKRGQILSINNVDAAEPFPYDATLTLERGVSGRLYLVLPSNVPDEAISLLDGKVPWTIGIERGDEPIDFTAALSAQSATTSIDLVAAEGPKSKPEKRAVDIPGFQKRAWEVSGETPQSIMDVFDGDKKVARMLLGYKLALRAADDYPGDASLGIDISRIEPAEVIDRFGWRDPSRVAFLINRSGETVGFRFRQPDFDAVERTWKHVAWTLCKRTGVAIGRSDGEVVALVEAVTHTETPWRYAFAHGKRGGD